MCVCVCVVGVFVAKVVEATLGLLPSKLTLRFKNSICWHEWDGRDGKHKLRLWNSLLVLRNSVEDTAVVGVSMATTTSIVNLAFWMR